MKNITSTALSLALLIGNTSAVNPGCLSYCEQVLLRPYDPPDYCRSSICGGALEAESADKTIKDMIAKKAGRVSNSDILS
jgi:hypothetical protein